MIYYSKWSKEEVEGLALSEIFEYVENFREIEAIRIKALLKGFASYNLQATRLGFSGKKSECERFLKSLEKDEDKQEQEIDEQFKGLDFGE